MNDAYAILDRFSKQPREPGPGYHLNKKGILCCDKCGIEVEAEVPSCVPGEPPKRVRALCACEVKERDEAQAKAKEQERKDAAYTATTKKAGCFAKDNGRQSKMQYIRRYVDNWDRLKKDGWGLLLWGDTGTGKSFAAECVVDAVTEKGSSAKMMTTSEIILEVSSLREGKAEYIRNLCGVDLLVLDDFGAERNTDYGQEIMYDVVDRRSRSGKPMIVTTNLTHGELAECKDTQKKRLCSRILENKSAIHFSGSDMRLETSRDKAKTYNAMLLGE